MNSSRTLLRCGIVLMPLFYVTVAAQLLTRSGFDITRHPLSLLSLGHEGWIQIANFLIAGMLGIACALGLRTRHGRPDAGGAAAALVATFGVGMIIAGLFPPDALLGFPPGSPDEIPARMSGHAILHGVGFFIAFVSLIASCFVLARRFARAGESGWSLYSATTGALTLVLIAGGMAVQSITSLAFFAVGIVAFGWLGAVCAHFDKSPGPSTNGGI